MTTTQSLKLSPADELDSLQRRASLYNKLRPYEPAGVEAVLAALKCRGRCLTLAARIEATANRRNRP